MTTKFLKYCLIAIITITCQLSYSSGTVGIFSDPYGESACTDSIGILQCYVTASSIEDSVGVSGWEFQLEADNGIVFLSHAFPVAVLNLEIFPKMIVGCSQPLPPVEYIELLTFSVYVGSPGSIYISPCTESSAVGYLAASSGEIRLFNFAFGGIGSPVFSAGGAPCPEPNEPLDFVEIEAKSIGSIKCLFQ